VYLSSVQWLKCSFSEKEPKTTEIPLFFFRKKETKKAAATPRKNYRHDDSSEPSALGFLINQKRI